MTLICPNIVPENNLRLPDALTIKHGPAQLIAKFVLEGDKAARRMGIRLRLRHDFHDLVYVNKERSLQGDWFRLVDMFNPEYCDLSVENSYWISGEDDRGEIMLTQAGRIFYWPETTLESEARLMFYGGHDVGQRCLVTAPAAKLITSVVFCVGSHLDTSRFSRHPIFSAARPPRKSLCSFSLAGPLGDRPDYACFGQEGNRHWIWLPASEPQHLFSAIASRRSRTRRKLSLRA